MFKQIWEKQKENKKYFWFKSKHFVYDLIFIFE